MRKCPGKKGKANPRARHFAENFNRLVLAGNGFNDFLFIPGSTTFASIGPYTIIGSAKQRAKTIDESESS
jgi:hypothetical protein